MCSLDDSILYHMDFFFKYWLTPHGRPWEEYEAAVREDYAMWGMK
jgi:hypothetical protein